MSPSPRALLAFFQKVQTPNGIGGCWLWSAANNGRGYGLFGLTNKTDRAHRVAYRWFRGEIPAGLTVDHLCRNSLCVNPEHLEAVTQAVNTARAVAARPPKTHCAQGHPLVVGNIYREACGRLRCRICRQQIYQRWKASHVA